MSSEVLSYHPDELYSPFRSRGIYPLWQTLPHLKRGMVRLVDGSEDIRVADVGSCTLAQPLRGERGQVV